MRSATLVSLLLAGCVPFIAEPDDGPGLDPQPVAGSLTIPVVPVDVIPLNDMVDHTGGGPGTGVSTSGYLSVAIGEDYPTALTLFHGEIWESRCLWEGTWTPSAVESSDPSVITATLDGDDVSLDVVGEGTAEVTLSGVFDGGCPWEGRPFGEQRLTRVVEVVVAAPQAASLVRPYACNSAEDAIVVTDAPLGFGFAVKPLAQQPYWVAANAREDRQIEVTLDLPDGTTATPPPDDAGIEAVVFHGEGGIVGISTPAGPAEDLILASQAEVTELDLSLVIPYGGRGQDLPLHDGDTVSWSDVFVVDERVVAVRAGTPRVGDAWTCAVVPEAWIELDVDPPQAEVTEGAAFSAEFMAQRIVSDGDVTFRLAVPELNGGAGLEEEIAVTFTE